MTALVLALPLVWPAARWLHRRVLLSRAKHPSLSGHARIARVLAKVLPFHAYAGEQFYASDGAPAEIATRRRAGFERLGLTFRRRAPVSVAATADLERGISDARFTGAYRVPFQFRDEVRHALKVGTVVAESSGQRVRDLDGNWYWDLTGSYGVNVHGYDFYKSCIDAGIERVRALGPVLGPYHPVVQENVRCLQAISGKEEVSFHMSGTEAVMQAVGLARYHTGRSRLVRFCGAYHGWWDGVQPGVGNPRQVRDVFTLRDMDERSLRAIAARDDVACVLVNPLQALHPNANAPGDATLIASDRSAGFDREAYARWLHALRDVCTERGIVLIFDEIMVGFRIARRGAQEYFGVDADLVTYGKTLGGGLPVGVVCGPRRLMQRFRPDRPTDVCFARGTFNSHPYVMGAMNEYLRRMDQPEHRLDHAALDHVWNARAAALNACLEAESLPVRVANLASIWTVLYTAPGRYNWMFQYYLRARGLALSWVGSGRIIFAHALPDAEFAEIAERFVGAARDMQDDGWWWCDAALSNRSIRRRVLGELVAAGLREWVGRRGSASPAPGDLDATPDPVHNVSEA